MRRHGLDITVRRVTLDPFEGLVAENVRLHRLNDRHTHLLTIRRAALDVNLRHLIGRRSNFLRSVDLRDTRLDLPVDPADPEGPTVRVRRLRAKLYFLPDRIQLAQAEGDCNDIRLSAAGEVLHPELLQTLLAAQPAAPPLSPEERTARRRRGAAAILNLRRLHFEGEPPRLVFRFNADLARPLTEARASVDLSTAGVRLRPGGYTFRQARGRVDLENGVLRLREGELTDARGRLGMLGEYRPASGEIQFSLDGGCDLLAIWRHLRGPNPGPEDPLAGLVLKDPPRLRLDARLRLPGKTGPVIQPAANPPPVPTAGPDLQLTGHAGLGRTEFRGVSLERFDTDFSWHRGQWFLRGLRLVTNPNPAAPLGPERPAQTLEGDVLCANGQFRARFSGALGPAALLPLLSARVRNALGEWQFQELPRLEINAVAPFLPGTTAVPEVNWERLHVDGRLTLGRTHFRGVPLRKLSGDFTFHGAALTLRNFRLEREEGSASADGLIYDFARHEARIENLRATLFPAEVAVWIDSDLVKAVRPYRFARPPATVTNGVVQFEGGMNSRLFVDFTAPAGLSYTFVRRELAFASASGRVVFTDPRLFVENLRGALFGGTLRGGLELNLLKGAPPDYSANLELSDVDFTRLTKLFFGYDESQGRLFGALRWSGRGEDPGTMRGVGGVRVERGNVFAIPVLGPLSPVLNEVLPGVGLNVARLATADFIITGGKIYNGNLNIKGTGFSMLGGGWLGFVDDTMNFRLRLNAQGIFGAVLYPVSKLFEYGSQGPLHKPVWRPRVLAAAITAPAAEPPPAVPPAKKPVRKR